jgi:hypothetical protein
MATESKLLINESPLVVLPSLVKLVGIERAIILQQIQYLSQLPNSGEVLDDGYKYIWNTAKDFTTFFPFWKAETIAKHLRLLENDKWLIACQPRNFNRIKYYRINYDRFDDVSKLQSNVYDDTDWKVDADTDCNVDSDTHSSSQKTSSKDFSKVNTDTPAKTETFSETDTLLDYRFRDDVNETLTWILQKKGVHKRNLPTIEWLNWFTDLESEQIDLKSFREFYEYCEKRDWVIRTGAGITPNLMRRELENFKRERKPATPTLDLTTCADCQGKGFTTYFDKTAQKEKAIKCNHTNLKQASFAA